MIKSLSSLHSKPKELDRYLSNIERKWARVVGSKNPLSRLQPEPACLHRTGAYVN